MGRWRDSTANRLLERIAADPGALERIRAARAEARAWGRGARPRLAVIDFDATLLIARSAKQGAAATFRGGFGFHPMLAYLDGSEEAPAGMLRPGNAAANTAADQIAVLDAALAQLLKRTAAGEPILVRADSAGATHALLHFCRDRRLLFSVGFDLSGRVRAAILALDERVTPVAVAGRVASGPTTNARRSVRIEPVSTVVGQPQSRRTRSVAKTRVVASAVGVRPHVPSSEGDRHARAET